MAQTIIGLAALLTVATVGTATVGGATAGVPTPAPTALTGRVTYYNPGVMEATYNLRLTWRHVAPCGECVGMLALLDREHLGRRVWLQRSGQPPEGPFLVVDCAAAKNRAHLLARGLVAEVDWPTARRWRMAGPIDGVTVYFATPIEKPIRSSARPPNDSAIHALRGPGPRRSQVE